MFGHALRMNENSPARKAMKYVFHNIYADKKFHGRPRTTLVTA